MIALLLVNFVLMAFSAKDITTGELVIRTWTQTAADFVQSPVTSLTASISNYFSSIANLRSAQSENDILKQRVQELEVEVKAKKKEMAKLWKMGVSNALPCSSRKPGSKVQDTVLIARIIGRDPSVWFDTSVVNRGSLDGVKMNMPVVTEGGIVGRVTAVSPLTSQVDLVHTQQIRLGWCCRPHRRIEMLSGW